VKTSVEKVQRLRVWFGKLGSVALISHLDLMRLWERACRRAGLPIGYSEGFHPLPKISIAKALPLGHTSTGEILDMELTAKLTEADVLAKLQAELPPELPLYRITEIPLTAPAAERSIQSASYILTIQAPLPVDQEQLQRSIEQILNTPHIPYEQISKSGKVQLVNLRERLESLELRSCQGHRGEIFYQGSCTLEHNLKPQQVLWLLQQFYHPDLALAHTHRQALI
jgi:radical SAM-linked protein